MLGEYLAALKPPGAGSTCGQASLITTAAPELLRLGLDPNEPTAVRVAGLEAWAVVGPREAGEELRLAHLLKLPPTAMPDELATEPARQESSNSGGGGNGNSENAAGLGEANPGEAGMAAPGAAQGMVPEAVAVCAVKVLWALVSSARVKGRRVLGAIAEALVATGPGQSGPKAQEGRSVPEEAEGHRSELRRAATAVFEETLTEVCACAGVKHT